MGTCMPPTNENEPRGRFEVDVAFVVSLWTLAGPWSLTFFFLKADLSPPKKSDP